jgi:hypothetical protein
MLNLSWEERTENYEIDEAETMLRDHGLIIEEKT